MSAKRPKRCLERVDCHRDSRCKLPRYHEGHHIADRADCYPGSVEIEWWTETHNYFRYNLHPERLPKATP